MSLVEATPDTRLLREGVDPYYARLRELLTLRGLDPDVVALAEFFPDDNACLFGIVAAPTGQVFEFDFDFHDFRDKGDLRFQIAHAVISSWTETTETWQQRPFAESVETARRTIGLYVPT
jgi:hypothetical protein